MERSLPWCESGELGLSGIAAVSQNPCRAIEPPDSSDGSYSRTRNASSCQSRRRRRRQHLPSPKGRIHHGEGQSSSRVRSSAPRSPSSRDRERPNRQDAMTHRRRALVTLCVVAAALAYYVVSGVRLMRLPGLQSDELLFVNIARGIYTSPETRLLRGIPVMSFHYIGSLKSYLYVP